MAGFNAFLKNNNIITGTAIPTEGNFKTGDIIVNVGPNSATEPMWICNEGGNPGIWGPVGVGSGSIVSINSSVLINEPVSEVSLASLGVGVSKKDKLLVHYNSTHLLEGVHFEINEDGSKIVKLGGGNWNPDGLANCIFAFELFKGVDSIDGDKIVVDSKLASITNHVVIGNGVSEVEIGIEGFNAESDMMMVFKNSVFMVEGVDYQVNGNKIVSTGEVWNENGIADYGITFVVFKEVVEYDGSAEVKAENIADGSIGIDKLGEDVREAIEAAGNIDLSGYATKEELNELFQDVDSGKGIIADAIDDRNINKDSTFAAMGEAIEGIHADREEDRQKLIEILVGSNVDLTGNESMDTLLDLIDMSNLDLSKVVQVACGYNHTFILKNDGSVYSCGNNEAGQLGLGTSDTNTHSTFTQVTTNINNDVKQIACGSHYSFIIKNDGSLWACGRNVNGELGLGDTTNRTTFTQVTTNINNDVEQVACGYDPDGYLQVFIIKNDGSLWACGRNANGQLGLGNKTANITTFTQVTTNINNDVKQVACSMSHTFILKNDGSIYSCGLNSNGELGLGNTTAKTSFTKVTTNINNDVKQIACGMYYTFILKNDGSVWSCGYNYNGQLGIGTSGSSANKTSFTQVTTNINNDVKQIACGNDHTVILKNDGSVWGCGLNTSGQLGLGIITNKSTFTQVTTNINNDVKQIYCGCMYTFIIKNDGSIWSCGWNNVGQLGLGSTNNQSVFMSVNQTEALQTQVTALQLEATTNRGNLATVLTDEGVELTGDETLADLIVKTDEEFDRKNSIKPVTRVTISDNDLVINYDGLSSTMYGYTDTIAQFVCTFEGSVRAYLDVYSNETYGQMHFELYRNDSLIEDGIINVVQHSSHYNTTTRLHYDFNDVKLGDKIKLRFNSAISTTYAYVIDVSLRGDIVL